MAVLENTEHLVMQNKYGLVNSSGRVITVEGGRGKGGREGGRGKGGREGGGREGGREGGEGSKEEGERWLDAL